MRSLTYFLLLNLTIVGLSSCLQDSCESEAHYVRYDPVYVPAEVFRTDIRPEGPRALERTGKIYTYQQYLFINEPEKGIHLFDNSDPKNPLAMAFLDIPGNVDLAVQNDFLYADNYVDLVVFDIADPRNIQMVGRTEGVFPGYGFDPVRGFLVDYEPTAVVETMPCTQGDWFWGRNEQLWIDVAFDASAQHASAPLPNQVGTGGSLARFTIGFNRLYVADDSDQVQVFSLNAPTEPELIHTQHVGFAIETIFPYGSHLFIGARNGMHILDATNPDAPEYVSTFWHTNACDPVFIDGNIAYITLRDGTECETFANQLDVVDISDLFHPQLMETFPMHHPIGLSVRDQTLYLCDDDAGLKVFDARVPDQVGNRLLKHLDEVRAIDVIAIPGRPILLMIGPDGLYQYDISQADDPQLVSVIPTIES